jgi:hypothetical protein
MVVMDIIAQSLRNVVLGFSVILILIVAANYLQRPK